MTVPSINKPTGALPRCTAPASFLSYSTYKFFYLAAVFLAASEAAALTENINFKTAGNNTCIAANAFDATVDYFPIKIENDTAVHFDPNYKNKAYKIFDNTNADPYNMAGLGPRKDSYVLYQCGTPLPGVCKTNVTGSNRTTCISVPAKTIGISDTVGMTFLEILGLTNRIRYTDSLEWATSPCLQKWAQLQQAKGINISVSDDPVVSAKQKAEVDVYFQSSGDLFNSAVFTSESSDVGALNRPDWLGFFAAFFNMEAEYHQYMNGLRSRWYEIANKTASLSPKPVIAYINYDNWNKSDINFQVLLPPYMNDSIRAAGAIPLEKKSFKNETAFKEYIKNAAIVIDQAVNVTVDGFMTKYNFKANDPFAFITDKAIYAIDKRMGANGGSDWFESVLAKPDLVLRDLVTIAHPGVLDRERTYLRHLYTEKITVLTADQCSQDLSLSATPTNTVAPTGTAKPSVAPIAAPVISMLVAALATVVVALA